jgi:hypothetical protein
MLQFYQLQIGPGNRYQCEIPINLVFERRGGRIGEKTVMLLLPKNRPVQHTFEI